MVFRHGLTATVLSLGLLCLPAYSRAQTQDSTGITAMIHDVALGYAQRAHAAEQSGHALEAEVLYLRAAETDSGLLDAWLGYARTLDARQHRDEAVALLSHLPSRAWTTDHDVVDLARALASLDRTDDGLNLLRTREHSPEALRALADMAAAAGRFPVALAAARRLAELTADTDDARRARVLVRALGSLVAEADAVRFIPATAPVLRRLLRGD